MCFCFSSSRTSTRATREAKSRLVGIALLFDVRDLYSAEPSITETVPDLDQTVSLVDNRPFKPLSCLYMSDKLLDVRNLSISFKSDHRALRVVSDISFDIGKAEIFGLVGESGSGKSMTALSILRILPVNAFAEGNIIFKDRDLLTLDEDEMRGTRGKDISIIFQEPMTSLNPVLTVGYQVAEALRAHFDISKSDAMGKAVELLRSVRIPSPETRIRDYPHQLSGGMRQRVMIAMAIACNPALLIADEPTTALDVTIQAQILNLLQSIAKRARYGGTPDHP